MDIYSRIKKINAPKMGNETLNNLKEILNIKFSNEYINLNKLFDFQYFSYFPINNLEQTGNYSVIGDTLRLRKASNLPLDTLFLFEDDASVLLMKCLGDHEEIYWIAVEDFHNYCEGKKLEYNPTIFYNFTEFFKFLLTEEEKIRGRD